MRFSCVTAEKTIGFSQPIVEAKVDGFVIFRKIHGIFSGGAETPAESEQNWRFDASFLAPPAETVSEIFLKITNPSHQPQNRPNQITFAQSHHWYVRILFPFSFSSVI